MLRFDKEQLVIDVAGMKMGGQPGEYPTVLAGTIFYGGHNIISDEKEGVFDKDAAEERIKTMEEMSDVTGNPCVVQTFGATAEAMVKYLEFVGDVCDKPFLIDSTAAAAKIAGELTKKSIEKTIDDPSHNYGVKFEQVIPYIYELLKSI